jgi:EmrB/QacA subfamily drug resistance transporter
MNTRQRWTLILTSVASLMVSLDMLVVVTALNTIRKQLGGSVADLDWTMNAYTLTVAVLLLAATAAGDRLGRRRVLAAGLAVFIASSASCALAPSIGVLIAARAIQGVGTAMVLPQAFALVGATFPAQQRGKAMGIFAGITGLATVGGPVVGGAVVQGLAWQWIFWLNVPIGIVLIPMTLRRVEESYGPRVAFDVPGLVLSGAAAFGLVWGLVRGNAAGWGSAQVSGPLVAGAVLLAGFAAWERRARSPMVPVSLFRNAAFVSAMACGFLIMGAIAGTAFFLAQYVQAGLGQGPLGAGLRMLPWTAVLFLIAPMAGTLAGRLGERPVVMAGLVAQAAGFGWMALESGAGYLVLVPAMVLAGIGVSAAMPATQSAAMAAVPRQQIGVASGTYNVMRMLGNTFGIAIASVAFSAHGSFASPAAAGHGFRAALITTAIISAAGALTSIWLRTRKAAPLPDTASHASRELTVSGT